MNRTTALPRHYLRQDHIPCGNEADGSVSDRAGAERGSRGVRLGGLRAEPAAVRRRAPDPARPRCSRRCGSGSAGPHLARPAEPARSHRVEAWSYRLLVRACQDEMRKRRGRPPVLPLVADHGAVDQSIGSLADRDQLERAFRDLSPEQRAAVVLHYYRDLSLSEIAEVLGVPIGTIRSRLHYARRSIRAAVEADTRAAHSKGSPA